MKKIFVLCIVVVAIMALSATSAFAYKVDTINFNDARHGSYAATTNACKACHDVHGGSTQYGTGIGPALYRWDTVAAGCNYCHLGVASATTTKVYTLGTPVAEHTIGAAVVYDSTDDSGIDLSLPIDALDCFDCHNAAPHGAGAAYPGATGTALISDATVNGFCARCHDLNDNAVTSHPLAAADTVTSWVGATMCTSCHTSGVTDGFPHQDGADYAFLGVATVTETAQDAKCITCHISGTLGVGLTY
ncbi:MAG: hypothetical protein CVT60_07120 [Actinobacteria bacterium HGW-Actinobacteria-10]|jgi:hypothetical protein|nr:MAG: hypothetical protein CVT60_07120 [Actinobacteria bacterium HGW-Actinobacteria-10]